MNDVIEDVSKITTIPKKELNKLIDKAIWVICDCLEQSKMKNQNITDLDIGLGILTIYNSDDDILYRFTPNAELEQSILSTLVEGKNPLELTLETKLVNKILNTYKNIV